MQKALIFNFSYTAIFLRQCGRNNKHGYYEYGYKEQCICSFQQYSMHWINLLFTGIPAVSRSLWTRNCMSTVDYFKNTKVGNSNKYFSREFTLALWNKHQMIHCQRKRNSCHMTRRSAKISHLAQQSHLFSDLHWPALISFDQPHLVLD